ncbi:Uncharacterised protein [uncultured archaeon]|nr:Uncharacterised protein [uncultured archaeon]
MSEIQDNAKELIATLKGAKKVRRVISLSREHDFFLEGYNASDLISLLLERFIEEKRIAEAARG